VLGDADRVAACTSQLLMCEPSRSTLVAIPAKVIEGMSLSTGFQQRSDKHSILRSAVQAHL
jgi:hypothetical protein